MASSGASAKARKKNKGRASVKHDARWCECAFARTRLLTQLGWPLHLKKNLVSSCCVPEKRWCPSPVPSQCFHPCNAYSPTCTPLRFYPSAAPNTIIFIPLRGLHPSPSPLAQNTRPTVPPPPGDKAPRVRNLTGKSLQGGFMYVRSESSGLRDRGDDEAC